MLNGCIAKSGREIPSMLLFCRHNSTVPSCDNSSMSVSANRSYKLEDRPIQQTYRETETHVAYFYLIQAAVVLLPAICYFCMYFKLKPHQPPSTNVRFQQGRLTFDALPFLISLAALMLLNLVMSGVQSAYGNMLMTFVVLGPLQMSKTSGVVITSISGASKCLGNLTGAYLIDPTGALGTVIF